MRRVAPIAAFAVIVGCVGPRPARADTLPPEAKALYNKGVTEYDLGHFKEALADFEAVYSKYHPAALLFNIAQCHRLLDETKEAAAVYRSFISRDPHSSRVHQARELLDQMEAILAKEEARDEQSAEAKADIPPSESTSESKSPAAPANPTEDVGLVEAQKRAVAVAPPLKRSTVKPPAPPAAMPTPGNARAAARHRTRVWAWVASGGAVAAVGVGAFFGARSSSTKSELAGSDHPGSEVSQLQTGEVADAHRADALFIAAGALAALGIACFALRF